MDRAQNNIAEDDTVTRTLPKGLIKEVKDKFSCHRNTVTRLWKRALQNFASTGVMRSVSAIKEQSGRKQLYNREDMKEAIIM